MVKASKSDVVADRYELEQMLGEGGMGRVYRAFDRTLGRQVALKVLLPKFAADEQARVRFEREAKVAARLHHPHAVRIFDFGADGDRLYLSMDLLDGETLRAKLRREGPRPAREVVEIGRQLADVLVAAERLELVHRDLKPENIIIESASQGPRAIVLDFGMAFLGVDEPDDDPIVGRLTRDGLSGGTPEYMSPEQVQGSRALTPVSDVYALGCVLYEMLVGEAPFEGPMMKVLTGQMYRPAPDIRPRAPSAPQALVELVGRMLSKKPATRPSAATVMTRLVALNEERPSRREQERESNALAPRRTRMLTSPPKKPGPVETLTVALLSPLPEDTVVALATAQIIADATDSDDTDIIADLVYADANDVDVAELCARVDAPVIVSVDALAIHSIAELLRAGVADVVTKPVAYDELVRKLRRAARKAPAKEPK